MTSTIAARSLALAALLTMAGGGEAAAQMFVATGHDTLRSLPGVEVIIEPLDAQLERPGLTAAAIRAATETQVRDAGITVYATQQQNPSAAKAYLYVDVTGVPIAQPNLLALSIQVQVRQTLRSLVTTSNIVDAMTWDARTVLVVAPSELARVNDTIREYVGQFVSDWRRVH